MGKKYVITSNGAGSWVKGDVVDEDRMHEMKPGTDVNRLLALHAMREATPSEETLQHVDVVNIEQDLSVQHRLAEKDAQIVRLKSMISELEGRLARPLTPMDNQVASSVMFQRKELVIAELQGKLQGLPALERELNNLRSKNQELLATVASQDQELQLLKGTIENNNERPLQPVLQQASLLQPGPSAEAAQARLEEAMQAAPPAPATPKKRGPQPPPGANQPAAPVAPAIP